MFEEKDFVMVETEELTCNGCIFGATRNCQRPEHFRDCEQDSDNNVIHYIYKRADNEHTTS